MKIASHCQILRAVVAFAAVASSLAIYAQAQTLATLAVFVGKDGFGPNGLMQAADGNFYGTTYEGGFGKHGTVFKVDASGELTTLHSFCSQPRCFDGALPVGGVLQSSDGDLYGVTEGGGIYGYGTIFKIGRAGGFITLHSFNGADGSAPLGKLVQGSDGNFYGTTYTVSTVFEITPGGAFKTLYVFCDQKDGCGNGPSGQLLQAADGNFYGTTQFGGVNGWGTIFRITPRGRLTTMHSFCSQTNCADGAQPGGGLVQGADGNLYGNSWAGGGQNNGFGTTFKITLAGVITTLYRFNGIDGSFPLSLVQATDGNLYGTTEVGGMSTNCSAGCGTVFKMTPAGVLTSLYSFYQTENGNGEEPEGLVQATDGSFYGVTFVGPEGLCGFHGCGTVFTLDMGLAAN
jgi:uncharacterized repeat protein (TIGR03803 family)